MRTPCATLTRSIRLVVTIRCTVENSIVLITGNLAWGGVVSIHWAASANFRKRRDRHFEYSEPVPLASSSTHYRIREFGMRLEPIFCPGVCPGKMLYWKAGTNRAASTVSALAASAMPSSGENSTTL